MKVVNLPSPSKKGLVSRTAKPKSTKRGDDSFEIYSDIIPYESGLPPISNIILEGSPPPFARTRSSRRSTSKPKPFALRPGMDAAPSSRTHDRKRKTSLPPPSTTTERRVCYL